LEFGALIELNVHYDIPRFVPCTTSRLPVGAEEKRQTYYASAEALIYEDVGLILALAI